MDKPAFNFASAAFFFFKALGRRPGAVIWILISQLVLYAVVYGLATVLLWPFYAELFTALSQGREPDEAQILAHIASLVAGVSIAVVGGLLALLLAQGAWLRLLTRDELAGGIPFRLGADEVRLAGVNILFLLVNAIFWGVLALLIVVPNVAAQASGGEAGAVLGGAAVSALLGVAAAIVWIVLAIKFAAAPAMSVQQGRFRFFGSFAATGGITAWLFLVYLVLIVIWIAGYFLISMIQNVVALLVAAVLIGALTALDPNEDPAVVFSILGELFTQPGVLIAIALMLLLQLIFQILFEALWHGPGAYAAVRQAGDPLAGGDAARSPHTPSASVGDAPGEG
jgi:hypothetical protein